MQHTNQTNPDQTQPAGARPRKKGPGFLTGLFVTFLFLALISIGGFAAWTINQFLLAPYDTRIYPNVRVRGEGLDVNLGGLTVEEATAVLAAHPLPNAAHTLRFSDGNRSWEIAWTDAGVRLDAAATSQAAFAVGREGLGMQTLIEMYREGHEINPAFTLDTEKAQAALEALAPQVAMPPTDATLRLEGTELVAVPGQPGQALDVEKTLENVSATITHLGPENQFTLNLFSVPPQLADVDAAKAQAEDMLDRQVKINAHDWFTDESFEWTLERDTFIKWLRIEAAQDSSNPVVRVDEQAISTTLETLSRKIGEGRGLDINEGTQQVLETFQDGGGGVDLRVTHPPRTYIVQARDDFTVIARKFGMPPGLIAEANPDIDPDWLFVGQEITIPSEDLLRPYPPVPGKRVEISIEDQRIRVYEDAQLLHEWPVSTGIASSPTYVGQFQVLGKNEKAYASQWDLWMPHFIAIYRAGGDTYNGIHALPILSSGRRLWEGSLGSPASYGCIILGIEEAETLFNWAEIGVPVMID